MNSTRALSARGGGLGSAGRVQPPTLAPLTVRQAEIRAFHPEPLPGATLERWPKLLTRPRSTCPAATSGGAS